MLTAGKGRVSLDRVTKDLIQKVLRNTHRASPVDLISFFFFLILFIDERERERERERQRQWQREKQAPCRDPRSPGSGPRLQAAPNHYATGAALI